jgi:hypothetical protein
MNTKSVVVRVAIILQERAFAMLLVCVSIDQCHLFDMFLFVYYAGII